MRFLLDMGLSRSTADFLSDQGHDTVHLRDQGLQRLEDDSIVRKARAEKRVILTHDLDFGRIVALSQSHIPSVITFRLSKMSPAIENRHLIQVLNRFAEELESGALVSISEQAIRVRTLPMQASS